MAASSTPAPWPLRESLFWLLLLAPSFFLTYGFANWVTAQRHDVNSVVFSWEKRIPFLAWTIVPYWSIDLLYGFSILISRTRNELRTHVKRLVLAQVLCIAEFLLFPLKFTFERPAADGLFGWMFTVLMGFDKPYNQAPSLHLALLAILWAKYAPYLKGTWLWLMRAWFLLIGVSTLTTYQHHFIDVPTGVWVGLLCVTTFPARCGAGFSLRRRFSPPAEPRNESGADDRFLSSAIPGSIRLAFVYTAASVLCALAAAAIGGLAWLLLWPSGSLLFVAVAYAFRRPELLRKDNSGMHPAMVWLIAPYIAAAWISSRLWTRRDPNATEIADGIWIGRAPRKRDRTTFKSMLDLTAEMPVDTTGVEYRCVPMLDLVVPSVDEINEAVQQLNLLRSHRPTLVHCALGYSRSVVAVAAWLVDTGAAATTAEAIDQIARVRRVVLSSAHRAVLADWERGGAGFACPRPRNAGVRCPVEAEQDTPSGAVPHD